MTTKLDTVFQLRRDTLDKWNDSSKVLEPGELALAYTDVETIAEGVVTSVPVVLLKAGELVNDSTKTFTELPFVSALAADVSAWAKKRGIEIEHRGSGSLISSVLWEDDKLVLIMTDAPSPQITWNTF